MSILWGCCADKMSWCARQNFLKDQEICDDNLGPYLLFLLGVFEKRVTLGTNKNEFWFCNNVHAMQFLML